MIKKVVYLVGGKGFVGSQIKKILKKKFIIKIITKKNFKYFKQKKCDFLIEWPLIGFPMKHSKNKQFQYVLFTLNISAVFFYKFVN